MYSQPHALFDIARRRQQELLAEAERARIRKQLRQKPMVETPTSTTVGSTPRLRLVPYPVEETPCPEQRQAS
jgi:hypothetical protein